MTIELSSQYNVIPIIIINGDFENGDLSHWTIEYGEEYVSVTSDAAHSGDYGLEISGISPVECEIHSEWFDVTNINKIKLWYKIPDLIGHLVFRVELYNGVSHQYLTELYEESSGWTQLDLDVSLYSGNVKLCIFVYFYTSGGAS